MNPYSLLQPISYYVVISSIIIISISFVIQSIKLKLKFGVKRAVNLVRFEVLRFLKGSAAGRMDAVIAGGLLLSLLVSITGFFASLYIVRYVLLVISTPFLVGLAITLGWKAVHIVRSKRTEEELKTNKEFSSKSEVLQISLASVIILTIIQLLLEWMPNLDYISNIIATIRNLIVAFYYIRPSLNILNNFDRPISEMRVPFNISELQSSGSDMQNVKMGVGKLSEFNSLEMASLDSCVEIGACESSCPATAAGRPLSPRVLIRKLALQKNAGNPNANPLDVINEEELWSCTTCGACVNSCPVEVKHLDVIYDLRRNLVENNKLDKDKSALLTNLYQERNSLGSSNADRNKWLLDTGVMRAGDSKPFEYLLWLGCMASFDPKTKQSVLAMLSLLKEAGELDKVAILGGEESCCGDPARRAGEEALFQDFAFKNIGLFKKYNVKKMLLVCPHGCNVFSNDYRKLDPWMNDVKVYHEVELLNELHDSGKLKFKNTGEEFAIHDPCYLSRYNDVIQPQRSLLKSAGKVSEPQNHGKETFCCGAGGANYWYKVPEKKRISHERSDQLSDTGAKNVVTMCPFCNNMLSDAVSVQGKDEKVTDISEVLLASLEKKGN